MNSSEEKTASDGASSSGVATEAKPNNSGGGLKSYFRVFTYADTRSWLLNVVAFAAAIAAGSVLPLMDLIFGKFVTAFTNFAVGILSPAGYRSKVDQFSLIFVYLFIAKFVLTYIHTVCISVAAVRTTKALRIDFLRHTLRQNIAYFDSADSTSVSIQATTNGNNVNTGISEKLTLVISGISTFVAAFVVAFAVQPKLAGITVSIVPTIVIVVSICIGIDTKNENEILSIHSKAGLLAEEIFASMRTVHSFWLHPILTKRYDALLGDAMKVGMKKSPNFMVLFSTEFFCVYSGYGLAFWQGIRMYSSGEITASGDVVTVIFAVIVAATAMTTIGPQIIAITKASAAAEELFVTIDRKSEIDSMSEAGMRPTHCFGDITVRNVHFAYPARKDVKVLDGLSLHIPAKRTTALVGASGSGKSTIVGLLERWYDIPDGEISLDGTGIRDLNIGWLRTNIRLVQQEPVLFNGTVFENVSYGLLGTKYADLPKDRQLDLVKEACKSAYAHEFIEQLPEQYDTQVGERAAMLSGGQKQRLAIARSIISDPTVLLLDEATSALDPKAERIVQQALDNVSANRTTLVIAHKLSTVRNCDNIAVMSKGTIIEQGTHDQLLAADGAYARLVKAQDLGHEASEEDDVDEPGAGKRLTLARTPTQAASISATKAADEDEEKSMKYSLVRCLWILLREQRGLWHVYVIVSIAATLGGLTYPAQAILFSRTLNAFQVQEPQRTNDGNFYSLMFFVVAIGNLFVFSVIGWFSNVIAQTVSRKYRLELFVNTLHQDMDFFDKQENGTGAIVSRLSSYPNNLLELLGFNIMLILVNIVNVVSSSILALIVGWKLGLVVVFGALPPLIFCGYLRIRLEFKLDDNTAERFASSASLAAEAVAAIRTVASLTLEKHILSSYQDRLSNVTGKSIKALIWTMFWYSFTQSISFLAMALGFWYGGTLVSTGEYTNTQFFIVFIGVIFSGEAAAAFFSYTTSITKAQTAANHILWFRNQIPTMREDPSQDQGPDDKADGSPSHIESEGLEFSYALRPNHKVIQNVDMDVKPGQFAAFVGPSGCGKSTMISLLERFYDPTSGCIRSNGTPISTLCPRRYRRSIALVQQEPVLYQGSIRDNIGMGVSSDLGEEATDAQVEDACRQANIYDFVSSLPDGLGTLCGSRGTQLSGGQRQRIAIARALIRQPRLLLLDEATSALDTESEKIVQAALDKAQHGRTTIAVAHRLSTIKDADCIMVFGKGRIVEQGTHAQLLAKRGVYYEMCLGQSLDKSIQ